MRRLSAVLVASLLAACSSIYWPTPPPRAPRTRLLVPPEFRIGVFDFSKDSTRPPETAAQAAACHESSAPRPAAKPEVAAELPARPAAPRGKKLARATAVAASPPAAAAIVREEEPRPVCEPGVHAAEFTLAIPAMLVDEMHEQGRFAVFSGSAFNENAAKSHVDGYLTGTVIKVSKEQVCFELRLANAHSYELIYTRYACVPLEKDQLPRRDSVKRVAQELGRAVKKVGGGQVTGVDGALVYINRGETAGVVRGMVAYVVASSERGSDATMLTTLKDYSAVAPSSLRSRAAPIIIGQIYILSTEDDFSIGKLYEGDYVLAGDNLFFK